MNKKYTEREINVLFFMGHIIETKTEIEEKEWEEVDLFLKSIFVAFSVDLVYRDILKVENLEETKSFLDSFFDSINLNEDGTDILNKTKEQISLETDKIKDILEEMFKDCGGFPWVVKETAKHATMEVSEISPIFFEVESSIVEFLEKIKFDPYGSEVKEKPFYKFI